MIDTRKIMIPRLDLVVAVLGFVWLAVALFTGEDPSRTRVIAYLASGAAFCLGIAVWTGFYLYSLAAVAAYLFRNRKAPKAERKAPSTVSQPTSYFDLGKEDKRNLRRRANRYGSRRIAYTVDALLIAALAVFIAKFSFSVPTATAVFGAGLILFPATLAMRLLSIIRRSVLFYWDLRENGIREA